MGGGGGVGEEQHIIYPYIYHIYMYVYQDYLFKKKFILRCIEEKLKQSLTIKSQQNSISNSLGFLVVLGSFEKVRGFYHFRMR